MNIGIVTWFHYINYGTVLQAYALQQFLKKEGYNCVIVNYIPQLKTILEKIKYGKYIKRTKDKIESIKFRSLRPEIIKQLIERKNLFRSFVERNINLTPEIRSNEDLRKLNESIDCFICGSDQIWNPENLNGIYFLNFVDDGKKKIAYAPSFGVRRIPVFKKRKIQKWINRYDKLSVREEVGVNILKSLTSKKAEVVLDPTLLLSEHDWEKIMVSPNINDDYILCYFLGDRKEYWDAVDSLKDQTSYKVVVIPVKFNSFLKNYDMRISVGPEEFIGLIKNAKFIMTDSYHGTLFSIVFKKDFYVFKRFDDKKKDSQNSRIYNVLKMCNLEERIINNDITEKCKTGIHIDNFEDVYEIINDRIEYSKNFLLTALSE